MKFTIITVAYNEEKRIEETIRSVIGQDYKDFEYIIIDGNSSDKTLKIVNQLVDKSQYDVKIYSERDFGIYNAMNRGIARASGEYIIFMNAGDSFFNNAVLSAIVKQIDKYGMALYYGQAYILRNGKIKGINDFSKYRVKFIQFIEGNMPVHQSIVAPANFLKKHYFNEEYRIRADFDWLLKCYKERVRFINLGFLVCKYDYNGISERASYKKISKIETQIINNQHFPVLSKIYKILNRLRE